MKNIFKFLLVSAVTVTGCMSCSEDKLGESIFDIVERPLDRTSYTFPLDSFAKREFLEPYNLRYIYRMEDVGSDMDKNLTPAPYENSVKLAVLAKYLWYDVYKSLAGEHEVFLKKYSPRIIHVIGSKSYNPVQGTETLGVAEGGIKITLTNATQLNVSNIEMMNQYFFQTMHHEFSHILDQTKLRPTSFNLISNGQYVTSGWSDVPDSVSLGKGFVSSYASSEPGEDWVENIANYITKDSVSWSLMMEAAKYDWELIDVADVNEYNSMTRGADLDTVGYYQPSQSGDGNKVYRRVYERNEQGFIVLDEHGKPKPVDMDGANGYDIIMQKIELCRTYLRENFQIDLDAVRDMVQDRTFVKNSKGFFMLDYYGYPKNRLTAPTVSNPSVTLIDSLTNEVYKLKVQ